MKTIRLLGCMLLVAMVACETEWYPLCNWGWNGDDDGYYLSTVFDPSKGPSFPTSTRSSNLNCDMKILTNIRK